MKERNSHISDFEINLQFFIENEVCFNAQQFQFLKSIQHYRLTNNISSKQITAFNSIVDSVKWNTHKFKENMKTDLDFGPITLHYAAIDQKGDIESLEFVALKDVLYFMRLRNNEKVVYLLSIGNEVYVSEDKMVLMKTIRHSYKKEMFLQEYPSYEEAYIVALAMKEDQELCYSSETEASPYWKNKSIY